MHQPGPDRIDSGNAAKIDIERAAFRLRQRGQPLVEHGRLGDDPASGQFKAQTGRAAGFDKTQGAGCSGVRGNHEQ